MKRNKNVCFPAVLGAIILLCGLIFLGCSEEDEITNGGNEESMVIMPLKNGNHWWGTITYFDSLGTATDTIPIVYRIIGDTTFQSETWYKWELEMNDTIRTDSANSPLITNRQDGIYQWVSDSGKAIFWYKFPAVVGDTFHNHINDNCNVISIDTAISVSAGSYNCYHYHLENTSNSRTGNRFLAPNIGYIKWNSLSDTTSTGEAYVFERYELDSLLLN